MHGSTDEASFIRQLYWWSFTARLIAGVLGWYATVYLNLSLLEDGLLYDQLAARIADDWLTRGFTSPTLAEAVATRKPVLQLMILAGAYLITGGLQFTPLAVAAYSLITSWAPVLVYRIGEQLGAPDRAARQGAWLVALSPAFVFWSGALYKEGLVLVLLTLGVLELLRLQGKWSSWSILLLGLSLVGLYYTRFYLALILGIVFVLGLLLGRSRPGHFAGRMETAGRQLVLTTLFVALMVLSGFTSLAQEALPADLSEGLGLMQSSRTDLAVSARSGYLAHADVRNPLDALLFLPVGLLYFLTVPWPWDLGSMRQNMTVPETALWVLLYVPVLIGIRAALRKNPQGTVVLVAASLAICLFYALWITNVGTAYRLRIQVWVLWAPFAGWGLTEMPRRDAGDGEGWG